MAGTRITTLASPRALNRLPDAVRLAAFALAVLGIEVVLAAGLVSDRIFRLAVLIIAAGAVAFLFRFPMTSALAMLALTDFIFYPGLFVIPVGPIDAHPFELILVGLLVVALLQPRRHTFGGVTGLALAVFLGMVAASGIAAYSNGSVGPSDFINWSRPLFLLTFFYVVVRLFPTSEQRRSLMLGAAIIAAATGVVALLISLGWSGGESLQGEGSQIIREQEGAEGVQRVRLAGLSLGYGIFWYVATQLLATVGARRWGWGLLLVGIAVNIAVSFNRNMWLGLAVGFVLIMILGGPQLRGRFAIAIALLAAGGVLISAVGGAGEERLVDPVVERASTILSPNDVSQESSYEDRAQETDIAWDVARENALIGVGAGAPFGVYVYERIGTDTYVRTAQHFLHNQYLYLLLISGAIGLAAFITFLATPLLTAVRRVPRDPAIIGCAVGIAMIMMSAVVAIYFSVENMTPVLALLAGFIVADRAELADAAEDS